MTKPYGGDGKIKGARSSIHNPKLMADATLSQANPVSTTLYTALDAYNVEIISVIANITWAVTQPTPLEIVVTVDGNTIIYPQANPVSATSYYPAINPPSAENAQLMGTTWGTPQMGAYKNMCGRHVKVQVRVTWAVTQPTPLVCRVKYAKW